MNQKLINDFTEYMISDTTQSTIPVIRFFEWSDMNSTPLIFADINRFKEFMSSCCISWTKEDEDLMLNNSCYCSCPKNESKLICKKYLYQLKQEINGNLQTSYNSNYYPNHNTYWESCYD